MATQVSTPMLQPATQALLVPPGAVMSFAMSAAPVGWLPCDGSAISRTTYAPLFSAVRTAFGAGNGSSTFNVPDLRGEFIRGWSAGRDVGGQSGRTFGSTEQDAIRNITGTTTIRRGQLGDNSVTNITFPSSTGALFEDGNQTSTTSRITIQGGQGATQIFRFDASRSVPTADDNRPRNIALLYCIKF